MGHLVRYRTADGELRHEEAEDLTSALSMVEQLRNTDDVSDVRVYRDVPLRFETYVKVSVAEDEPASAPVAEPAEPLVAEDEPAPPAAPVEPPPGSMPLSPPVRQDGEPAKAEAAKAEPAKAESNRSLFHRG